MAEHCSASAIKQKVHPAGVEVWYCYLSSYTSEDGYQREYYVENTDREVVDNIASYWKGGGAKMLRRILLSVTDVILQEHVEELHGGQA